MLNQLRIKGDPQSYRHPQCKDAIGPNGAVSHYCQFAFFVMPPPESVCQICKAIFMQCTGLFESGDAMRNVVHDLQLPIFAVVGVRNWTNPTSSDSARRFAEPIATAWGLSPRWIADDRDKPVLATHYADCQRLGQPGLVLLAEGRG